MVNRKRSWRKFIAAGEKFFLIGCGFLLVSCLAYKTTPQVLPQHIKKIAVRQFGNQTNLVGLEDRLTLRVIEEFSRDGRFRYAPESEADGYLWGNITRYILQPLAYDANQVPTQYKLWILCDVYFVDQKENITLWHEPNMEGIEIYSPQTLGGISEENARELIWDKLARDIVRRTVEGFGAATGTSYRKVPNFPSLTPATTAQ